MPLLIFFALLILTIWAQEPSVGETTTPTTAPTIPPQDPHTLFNDEDMVFRLIRRAKTMIPNIDVNHCLSRYYNRNLTEQCFYRVPSTARSDPSKTIDDVVSNPCHPGPPTPRMAWLVSCMAREMIEQHNFQVPVYVVQMSSDPEDTRVKRVSTHLEQANFKHVHHISESDVSSNPHFQDFSRDMDQLFKVIKNRREGGQRTPEEHQLCVEIINASFSRADDMAINQCNRHGTNKLNKKEKSIQLKNLLVGKTLIKCIKRRDEQIVTKAVANGEINVNEKVDSDSNSSSGLPKEVQEAKLNLDRFEKSQLNSYPIFTEKDGDTSKIDELCFSPSSIDKLRYAIILEEDQFIPRDALSRIVETILHSAISAVDDLPIGFYALCDSYCQNDLVGPHSYLNNTPYSNGYSATHGKTAAAVMLSEKTIKDMYFNDHWLPIRRALDHWYNYLVYKEQVRVQYVFPPISCHGSQGIEEVIRRGWKTRYDSQHCCETFYDLYTMKPYFVGVKLVAKNSQLVGRSSDSGIVEMYRSRNIRKKKLLV